MTNTEKEKLKEVGSAMSPEEMAEIIKIMPPEVIINEIKRRFENLENLKKDIGSIRATYAANLADFSHR